MIFLGHILLQHILYMLGPARTQLVAADHFQANQGPLVCIVMIKFSHREAGAGCIDPPDALVAPRFCRFSRVESSKVRKKHMNFSGPQPSNQERHVT